MIPSAARAKSARVGMRASLACKSFELAFD
jgi:hypothetical protein